MEEIKRNSLKLIKQKLNKMKKNLKSLNFSYDLGGLASYTDALNSDIVSEAVLTPVTMEYVNVIEWCHLK
jgi:hypothetical protein